MIIRVVATSRLIVHLFINIVSQLMKDAAEMIYITVESCDIAK